MIDRKIDKVKKTPLEESPPEIHAEKCPVCNGFGTLKFGEIICHGCKGKGYIFVPNSELGKKI